MPPLFLIDLSVFHGVSNSLSLDLLNLSSVIVALLTSSGHGKLDSAKFPSSNTCNLPQPFMVLPRQLLRNPSAVHTLESMTKQLQLNPPSRCCFWHSQLVSNRPTIELGLHDVGLHLPSGLLSTPRWRSSGQSHPVAKDFPTDAAWVLSKTAQSSWQPKSTSKCKRLTERERERERYQSYDSVQLC